MCLWVRVVDAEGQSRARYRQPCGAGAQPVKWLGVVVAQRLSQRAPHGARRSHERGPIGGSFLLPGAVMDSASGSVAIDPQLRLCDVFADGDEAVVTIANGFSRRLQPKLHTNLRGAPQLTQFHQLAFHGSAAMTAQRRRSSNSRIAVPKGAGGDGAAMATTFQQSSRASAFREHAPRPASAPAARRARPTMLREAAGGGPPRSSGLSQHEANAKRSAAGFKERMHRQLVFHNVLGLMTEKERLTEVRHMVLEQMRLMRIGVVVPDAADHDAVADELAAFFPALNSMFKHYCGMGMHAAVDTLTFAEFAKLLTHAGLVPNREQARAHLRECYQLSAKQRSSSSSGGGGASNSSFAVDLSYCPDVVFKRHEYLEMVVRLAQRLPAGSGSSGGSSSSSSSSSSAGASSGGGGGAGGKTLVPGSASAALHELLESMVLPHILRVLDTPLHRGLADPAVQGMLYHVMPRLLTVYKHYAISGVGGAGRPTMDVDEYLELLRDAGLLDATHDSKILQAVSSSTVRLCGAMNTLGGGRVPFTAVQARVTFTAAQSEAHEVWEAHQHDEVVGGAAEEAHLDIDRLLVAEDSDSELIFAEFIEAVCRVAIIKWQHLAALSFQDMLKLATRAIVSLEHDCIHAAQQRQRVKRGGGGQQQRPGTAGTSVMRRR